MHRQLAAFFGPDQSKEFWLASLFLPALTLFRPCFPSQGKREQRAVEDQRIGMFRHGRLNDLFKLALEAQAHSRRSTAENNLQGMNHDEHTSARLLANGKVADLLTSAFTHTSLTHSEITNLLIPSQFPPLLAAVSDPADASAALGDAAQHANEAREPEEEEDDNHDASSAIQVTHEALLRAFARTKNTRGCTGIPTRYWALLARASNADRAITRLVQDACSNTVPACIRPILASVHYSCLRSQTNPDKVRAVGSNDSLLKVAQRYCLMHEDARIKAWANSTPEYAVGRPNGVAHMIGKLRLAMEIADQAQPEERESFGILAIDISAAFPTASRPLMRQQLSKHLPALLPVFDLLNTQGIRHSTTTVLGEVVHLDQTQGTVQGAECSALFFSLLSQLAIERSGRVDYFKANMCKYLDDHFLVGTADDLVRDFRELQDLFAGIGLKLNTSKTKIYLPFTGTVPASVQASGLAVASSFEGLIVLGAPLGNPFWVLDCLREKAAAFVTRLDVVKDHLSFQQRLHVLMHVASVFQHLQASCLPGELAAFNTTIDDAVNRVFLGTFYPSVSEKQLNTLLPGEHANDTFVAALLARARMPVAVGGCGIHGLQDRQDCSFAITTARLAMAEPELWNKTPTVLSDEMVKVMAELMWTDESLAAIALKDVATACLDLYRAQQRVIEIQAPDVMVRAMHSASLQGSGSFLFAAGKDADRTLSDDETSFAVRQRLGFGLAHSLGLSADPTQPAPGHCPTCGRDHPDWEEHLVSCRNVMLPRHDAIKYTLKRVFQAAGHQVKVEYAGKEPPQAGVPGLRVDLHVINPHARFNTAEHLHSAVDVTVGACTNPATLAKKERAKMDKYAAWGQAHHARIVPFAMSTHGALGKHAQTFLRSSQQMAVASDRYLAGVDEPWVPKWTRILACALVKVQAFHATRLANNRNGTTKEKESLFTGVERELEQDADAGEAEHLDEEHAPQRTAEPQRRRRPHHNHGEADTSDSEQLGVGAEAEAAQERHSEQEEEAELEEDIGDDNGLVGPMTSGGRVDGSRKGAGRAPRPPSGGLGGVAPTRR
jgi:hypothetical protein